MNLATHHFVRWNAAQEGRKVVATEIMEQRSSTPVEPETAAGHFDGADSAIAVPLLLKWASTDLCPAGNYLLEEPMQPTQVPGPLMSRTSPSLGMAAPIELRRSRHSFASDLGSVTSLIFSFVDLPFETTTASVSFPDEIRATQPAAKPNCRFASWCSFSSSRPCCCNRTLAQAIEQLPLFVVLCTKMTLKTFCGPSQRFCRGVVYVFTSFTDR